MTDDITQIKERQDRLEGRVTVLENTVNVEAIARAGMEDDLEGAKSDIVGLKASKKMLQTVITASNEHREQLQALAETTSRTEVLVGRLQADFKDRFDGLEASVNSRFAKVDARFDAVDARFAKVDERFDRLDTNVKAILDRLGPPPGEGNDQN